MKGLFTVAAGEVIKGLFEGVKEGIKGFGFETGVSFISSFFSPSLGNDSCYFYSFSFS